MLHQLTAGRAIKSGPVTSGADTADKHGHRVVVLGIVALVAVGNTSAGRRLQQAAGSGVDGRLRHAPRGTCQPAQQCKQSKRLHGGSDIYKAFNYATSVFNKHKLTGQAGSIKARLPGQPTISCVLMCHGLPLARFVLRSWLADTDARTSTLYSLCFPATLTESTTLVRSEVRHTPLGALVLGGDENAA